MPVKNKQKGKEPKVKNDKTAQQEQCSVVAIYYALNKDMSKQTTQDELFKHFSTIYPKITEKDGILWKQTFLEQAEVFKKIPNIINQVVIIFLVGGMLLLKQ